MRRAAGMEKGGRPSGQSRDEQRLQISKMLTVFDAEHALDENASTGRYGVDHFAQMFHLPGPSASAIRVLRHNVNLFGRRALADTLNILTAHSSESIELILRDICRIAALAEKGAVGPTFAETVMLDPKTFTAEDLAVSIMGAPDRYKMIVETWGQIVNHLRDAASLARGLKVETTNRQRPGQRHILADQFTHAISMFWFDVTGQHLKKSSTGTGVDFAYATWCDLRFPGTTSAALGNRLKARPFTLGEYEELFGQR